MAWIDDFFDEFDRQFRKQLRLMKKLMKEMNRRFSDLEIVEQPLMDIRDEGDKYVIEVDLPGVDKKDIELTVLDHTLKLRAKRKSEYKEKSENYVRVEKGFSVYERYIELPPDSDLNNIKAKYEDGVLRIEINKIKSEAGKRISVE